MEDNRRFSGRDLYDATYKLSHEAAQVICPAVIDLATTDDASIELKTAFAKEIVALSQKYSLSQLKAPSAYQVRFITQNRLDHSGQNS